MSPALGVAFGADARELGLEVLSSLPLSYWAAAYGQADVVVLGGGPSWGRDVEMIVQDGRAAVVVHPQPTSVDPTAAAGNVVLDSRWASNPAVGMAAPHFRDGSASSQLVEVRIVADDKRSAGAHLLDAAALVDAILTPVRAASILHVGRGGFLVGAETVECAVTISLIRTHGRPPGANVRMLTDIGSVEIGIPDPSTAAPAVVTITDPDGLRQLPTLWESGHRASWRRLHHHLTAAQAPTDVAGFARDQSVLSQLTDELNGEI